MALTEFVVWEERCGFGPIEARFGHILNPLGLLVRT